MPITWVPRKTYSLPSNSNSCWIKIKSPNHPLKECLSLERAQLQVKTTRCQLLRIFRKSLKFSARKLAAWVKASEIQADKTAGSDSTRIHSQMSHNSMFRLSSHRSNCSTKSSPFQEIERVRLTKPTRSVQKMMARPILMQIWQMIFLPKGLAMAQPRRSSCCTMFQRFQFQIWWSKLRHRCSSQTRNNSWPCKVKIWIANWGLAQAPEFRVPTINSNRAEQESSQFKRVVLLEHQQTRRFWILINKQVEINDFRLKWLDLRRMGCKWEELCLLNKLTWEAWTPKEFNSQLVKITDRNKACSRLVTTIRLGWCRQAWIIFQCKITCITELSYSNNSKLSCSIWASSRTNSLTRKCTLLSEAPSLQTDHCSWVSLNIQIQSINQKLNISQIALWFHFLNREHLWYLG